MKQRLSNIEGLYSLTTNIKGFLDGKVTVSCEGYRSMKEELLHKQKKLESEKRVNILCSITAEARYSVSSGGFANFKGQDRAPITAHLFVCNVPYTTSEPSGCCLLTFLSFSKVYEYLLPDIGVRVLIKIIVKNDKTFACSTCRVKKKFLCMGKIVMYGTQIV